MKYGNNNKLIDEVIIQEAKENDYNFNYIQIEADKKMTIKQKLDELILLYSSRERKNNNYINVYDGGKIIYNYEVLKDATKQLHENDTFSIRRVGKFKFDSIEGTTKSNNLVLKILKYIDN